MTNYPNAPVENRTTLYLFLQSLDLSDAFVVVGGAFIVISGAVIHWALGLAILELGLGLIGVRSGQAGRE